MSELRHDPPASPLDAYVRQRLPSLLAAARRVAGDEALAHAVVEEATQSARGLLPLFRASNPDSWLGGLVVGLALARAGRNGAR